MLKLPDNLKAAIIKMSSKANTKYKINIREIIVLKEKQMDVVEVKNTITKVKNSHSLDGLKSRLKMREERVSELEDRSI